MDVQRASKCEELERKKQRITNKKNGIYRTLRKNRRDLADFDTSPEKRKRLELKNKVLLDKIQTLLISIDSITRKMKKLQKYIQKSLFGMYTDRRMR